MVHSAYCLPSDFIAYFFPSTPITSLQRPLQRPQNQHEKHSASFSNLVPPSHLKDGTVLHLQHPSSSYTEIFNQDSKFRTNF